MDRVFLDSNVLFSAAYRADAGLLRLWELEDVELVTSAYAVEEARINLPERKQRKRLAELVDAVEVWAEFPERLLPKGIDLPEKDRPILLAAIGAKASHILTGDVTHFGAYFGKSIEGVLVLPPAEYLRSVKRRPGP